MRAFTAVFLLALVACSPDADVSRELGARCDSKADCAEKCLPDGADYPGGFCTTTCLTDADCPSDAVCVAAEGGVCLFTCAVEADCDFLGQGWQCAPETLQGEGEATVCNGD